MGEESTASYKELQQVAFDLSPKLCLTLVSNEIYNFGRSFLIQPSSQSFKPLELYRLQDNFMWLGKSLVPK